MPRPHASQSHLRVRYAETDAQGVVYYANYLVWFEVGRVDYLGEAGLRYADLERQGWGIMVVEASCRYYAPARFDDELTISTWCDDLKRTSFRFRYQVRRDSDNQTLAEGQTVQVFLNMPDRKPAPIPPELRELLEQTEEDRATAE